MSILLLQDPKAYWYLTRAFGLITFLLLTITLVIGVLGPLRWSSRRWPRFASQSVHGNAALLAMVLLVLHIATTLADGYAPVRLRDTVEAFGSSYRPIWMAFGALAVDILIALAITSVFRHKIGPRVWKVVHWSAYACWPFALLHFLGTGTDTKTPLIFGLSWACTAAVVTAVACRLNVGFTRWTPVRLSGAIATVAIPALIFAWAMQGPMQPGWAKRSGTPSALLAHPTKLSPSQPAATTKPAAVRRSAPARLTVPFTAHFTGTERRTALGHGRVRLDLLAHLSHGASGTLLVSLAGPKQGSGIRWTHGGALLGPTNKPDLYRGGVITYAGSSLTLRLSSAKSHIDVRMTLRWLAGGRIDGTVSAKRTPPAAPPGPVRVVTVAVAPAQPAPARPAAKPTPSASPPPAPAPSPAPTPAPTPWDDDGGDDRPGD
ncbi:MAG: methionine sulfoxide reductase heme-binding subunit [Frankiales bacterium]|jgi:DMSO/TMAO reductase YedYZ heme-binding membrane subunit|nr:methionine sulfoxide reductase heme-binding subunit [Frankiales bacterium]